MLKLTKLKVGQIVKAKRYATHCTPCEAGFVSKIVSIEDGVAALDICIKWGGDCFCESRRYHCFVLGDLEIVKPSGVLN